MLCISGYEDIDDDDDDDVGNFMRNFCHMKNHSFCKHMVECLSVCSVRDVSLSAQFSV